MPNSTSEPILAEKIERSARTRRPVEGPLKTNDRIIARVTDGIYREPWSAFRELISNAYDADATRVSIDCDYPFFREIRISDNGNGMDEKIVGDFLENIGGSSKRTARGKTLGTANQIDPTRSPAGRKLIGKIGIGLFAVAQLTQQFQIITKKKGDNKRLFASIQLHTYKEDSLIDEQDSSNYVSGTYSVLAEETLDTELHGTTVILTGIRPAVREKLQSLEIWGAVEESRLDDETGLLDVVSPPKYHIGKFNEKDELIEPPNLPWLPTDKPIEKFRKLMDAAVNTAKSSREQANLAHFDNYLKMLWRLSVASPIDYIDKHPFDLSETDGFDIYRLSNHKKGAASEAAIGSQSIRDAFGMTTGQSDALPEFNVTVDTVELRRPISLSKTLASPSRIEKPLIFVGSVKTNFGGATADRSGGNLAFDAYLYWNTRIVPKENIGAIIRVNDASGTLFDPEFLGYQVSEQTRKKQIMCEIFVKEGLDGALNIDRESFNTSNPHYLYIQRWLHSAFRQFATTHKRLGRVASQKEPRSSAQHIHSNTVEIWSKMRGSDIAPPPILRQSTTSNSAGGFVVGDLAVSPPRSQTQSDSTINTDLVDAIALVLDAHGILETLTEEQRSELIYDLAQLFGSAS